MTQECHSPRNQREASMDPHLDRDAWIVAFAALGVAIFLLGALVGMIVVPIANRVWRRRQARQRQAVGVSPAPAR
jgi:hypothetical protein